MTDQSDDYEYMKKLEVLTPEQLSDLNHAKVMIRLDNEHYLRAHPDIHTIMRALLRGIIRDQPENPSTYSYHFFSRSSELIRADLVAKE